MAQDVQSAAGVRRVWAGAGLQHAAYRGEGHIVRPRAQLVSIDSAEQAVTVNPNNTV